MEDAALTVFSMRNLHFEAGVLGEKGSHPQRHISPWLLVTGLQVVQLEEKSIGDVELGHTVSPTYAFS